MRRIAFEAMSTKRLVSIGFTADASCVSCSIQIGSSSKNFDVVAELIAVKADAANTTATAAARFVERGVMRGSLFPITSEARAEGEHHAVSLRCACEINTCDRSRHRVQQQSDAVGLLEMADAEVRGPRRHLSCVEEDRHVRERAGGPAILAAEEKAVTVSEPPRRITAERVAATKVRQQEVRHVTGAGAVGDRRQCAKSD